MEKIKEIWFDKGRIYMKSTADRLYWRLVDDFPILMKASDSQRARYSIVQEGQALRWDEIDEDIHISSFYERGGEQNELARIFYNFPMLSVSGIAAYIGMNETQLYDYVYGVKRPSERRMKQIKTAIHDVGSRLAVL